jgi:hypothetical protein
MLVYVTNCWVGVVGGGGGNVIPMSEALRAADKNYKLGGEGREGGKVENCHSKA